MLEKGRIVGIKGNEASVKIDTGEHCFGCMNRECKKKHGVLKAANPLGLPLEKGLLVTIEVRISSLAAQGIEAALPPLIGFIAAFVSVRLFFPFLGEGIRILCGLMIMAAAGAGFYLFRRKFPAKALSIITGIAVDSGW